MFGIPWLSFYAQVNCNCRERVGDGDANVLNQIIDCGVADPELMCRPNSRVVGFRMHLVSTGVLPEVMFWSSKKHS